MIDFITIRYYIGIVMINTINEDKMGNSEFLAAKEKYDQKRYDFLLNVLIDVREEIKKTEFITAVSNNINNQEKLNALYDQEKELMKNMEEIRNFSHTGAK